MQKTLSLTEIDKLHGFSKGTSNSIFGLIVNHLELGKDYEKKGAVRQGDGIFLNASGYLILYSMMPHTPETQDSMRKVIEKYTKTTDKKAESLEECISILRSNCSQVETDTVVTETDYKSEDRDVVILNVTPSEDAMSFAMNMVDIANKINNGDKTNGYYFLNRVAIHLAHEKECPTPLKRMSKENLYKYIAYYLFDYAKELEDALFVYADKTGK